MMDGGRKVEDEGIWRVQGMPKYARQLALEAATRGRTTVAGWLTHAIEAQVQAEQAQTQLSVPTSPATPTTFTPPPVESLPTMSLDLEGMATLLQAMHAIDPKRAATLSGAVSATLRQQMLHYRNRLKGLG